MAWGDPGVSKNLRVSNGVYSWGGGGVPFAMPIQQTGILRKLVMMTSATPTFTPGTGSIARDVLGPFNVHTNVALSPNQQAPILNVSGLGLALINDVKAREGRRATVDTSLVAEASAALATDVYSAGATTGTTTWRFPQELPVAQRLASLGGDIGLWPLQNPAMQITANVTPNSASAAPGPYNVYSLTAGTAPYLITGNATVTLGSPTEELIRDLWSVPEKQANMPPFELVSTWIEEQPQGANVAGASALTWMATPLSGILARIILYVFDSNANGGVASSNLSTSSALQLTYDANTVKFSESAYHALARQQDFYGYNLPQGAFVYDLLGPDLTLADSLNTNTIGNIKVTATFNSALGASSSAKIIRQIISPLEVK